MRPTSVITRIGKFLRARLTGGAPRPLDWKVQEEQTVARLRQRGVSIGERCRIYSHDFGTEPYLVSLGDDVAIAGGVKFLPHNGAARLLKHRRPAIQSFGEIKVGNDCFIGENALILQGTSIGNGCIIAPGAVVFGTFADNSFIMGNPAKTIGRASLFLERLDLNPNTLDTFDLPEDARRGVILAHFAKVTEAQ